MTDFFVLLLGLVVLVVAADLFLRGAARIAELLKVPTLVIGATVVAFGTSAPELVVSVLATLQGAADVAMGNIVGSNIANVLLVVGLPALVAPIACTSPKERADAIVMPAITAIFLILLAWDGLTRLDGLILFAMLGAFVFNLVRRRDDSLEDIEEAPRNVLLVIGFLVIGLIGLPLGANWIVDGASGLAASAGVPADVVALTIVAFGTSLPELVTVLISALRRDVDMALGNVVGSNIFNLLAVGGAASLAGMRYAPDRFWTFDFWVMGAAALVIAALVLGSVRIGPRLGALLTGSYIVYVVVLAAKVGMFA